MEYPAVNKNEKKTLSDTVKSHSKRHVAKRRRLFDDSISEDEDGDQDAYECDFDIDDDSSIHEENEDVAKIIEILTPSKRRGKVITPKAAKSIELSNLNELVGGILGCFKTIRLVTTTPAGTPLATMTITSISATPLGNPTPLSVTDTPILTASPSATTTPSETEQKKRKRKTAEKEPKVSKHPLLPTCSCKNQCIEKISEERRVIIHQQFWDMSFREQGVWSLDNVHQKAVQRHRSRKGTERKFSYEYYLKNGKGEKLQVCQQFLLHTLGLKSNKKLFYFFQHVSPGDMTSPEDRGGKQPTANKISGATINLINDHILAHNPAISHYRREHAPNKLYITLEMNATIMYKDFCEINPQSKLVTVSIANN